MNSVVAAWTSKRSRYEVAAALGNGGIPVGMVNTGADVLADPIFRDLGYFTSVDDGFGRQIDTAASPFGWSYARPVIPRVGEHTSQVLSVWLGKSDDAIEDLRADGAFGPQP